MRRTDETDGTDQVKMRREVSAAARMLGRLGRGVPKRYSAAERERRRRRLAAAREKRWKLEVGSEKSR